MRIRQSLRLHRGMRSLVRDILHSPVSLRRGLRADNENAMCLLYPHPPLSCQLRKVRILCARAPCLPKIGYTVYLCPYFLYTGASIGSRGSTARKTGSPGHRRAPGRCRPVHSYRRGREDSRRPSRTDSTTARRTMWHLLRMSRLACLSSSLSIACTSALARNPPIPLKSVIASFYSTSATVSGHTPALPRCFRRGRLYPP
jgi:hypothetical protein